MARQEKSRDRLIKGAADGFPRGTLIWARLFEAEAMEDGQEKSFSCAIMFKKGADLDALRRGYKAACVDQFGASKPPRRSKSCFIEGDELEELVEDYPYLEDAELVLKLRRYEKYGQPQLWDQNVEAIESPTEMYSGAEVVADVEFFGWERTSGSGVSCRVNGIQKVRDGEPLAGGNDTEDSFERVKVDRDERRGKSSRVRDKDDDDDRPRRRREREDDDVI